MAAALDDQELVRQALADRRVAFDVLMERYERLVYKVCSLYGKSREDSLDITQNVFLKAFSKLHSFRGEASFKTWLLKIAHREGLNWIRRHRRHEVSAEWDAVAARLVSPAHQEEEVSTSELRALLQSELALLSPNQRLALSLRYFQQMRAREIAEVLETSEGNVRSLLFRSLDKLRQRFREEDRKVVP